MVALVCQEALSERQFGKQTLDTYFDWSFELCTKRCYWSLNIGDQFFSGKFHSKIKFIHSFLSRSDGGSLWRLLCSLVHPKTQHLKCLFGTDIKKNSNKKKKHSNGGPLLLTQGCVETITNGRDFFPMETWTWGEIWNCSFRETVYDYWYYLKKWVGGFLKL